MLYSTECQENTGKIRINLYGKYTGSFIPDWLDEWKGIAGGAKRVYGKLVQFAGKNGKTFPSQKWLARKHGTSRQAVNTHIAELKENGLIETESRGYGRSLSYYFLWHEKIGNWANVLEEDNDPTPPAKGPDTSCQKRRHRKHNIKTRSCGDLFISQLFFFSGGIIMNQCPRQCSQIKNFMLSFSSRRRKQYGNL